MKHLKECRPLGFEVAHLIGPTDIYIFPFGDIETTMGHYKSDKYHLLRNMVSTFSAGYIVNLDAFKR